MMDFAGNGNANRNFSKRVHGLHHVETSLHTPTLLPSFFIDWLEQLPAMARRASVEAQGWCPPHQGKLLPLLCSTNVLPKGSQDLATPELIPPKRLLALHGRASHH